jgi:ribonuclease HII
MRISPDLSLEIPLWQAGLSRLAGLDEAGRGAWAGPVYAAAVILPPAGEELLIRLPGVRDSKLMTARQRTIWAKKIRATAAAWGIGWATNAEIDTQGILPATRLAMQRAVEQLGGLPEHLLIDAVRLPALNLPQTSLVRGDQRSLSIAAASVLAKTARDAFMVDLDPQYPGYGFAAHKGYGTARHQRALAELGPCPQHRFSFAPLRTRLLED